MIAVLLPIACTVSLAAMAGGAAPGEGQERTANVLLVILDDVPMDAVGCYPDSGPTARTPNIDALAARGVRFDHVWANPSCSPTRATIMTGRYGFRTGIGSVIRPADGDPGLLLEEVCLPEMIQERRPEVQTALLGKWHLSGADHGVDHPREQGFDHFRGTLSNLGKRATPDRYFSYREHVDGVEGRRDVYATTAVTDDTIAAIQRFEEPVEVGGVASPWFVVASYHAAHAPFHAPPPALHTQDVSAIQLASSTAYFPAMVEALDHELGRLFASLSPEQTANTVICVLADNGGASKASQSSGTGGGAEAKGGPGKGTLFEPGVRVPMIVAGPVVADPGRVCDHLVNTTDIFDSVLEWSTGSAPDATPDSISIQPSLTSADAPAGRTWLFAERFVRGDERHKDLWSARLAIRGTRFKLIEDESRGTLRFFDLENDPRERRNLLASGRMDEHAIAALARLTVVLAGPLGQARSRALADFR